MKKLFIIFLFSAFVLTNCAGPSGSGSGTDLSGVLNHILSRTGRLPGEDLSDIPQDVLLPPMDIDVSALPGRVYLEDIYPPIGDQGPYGTCVAWAVGYNMKTALNAIDSGWSVSDLARPRSQTSPKDLWFAIPQRDKGFRCGGTNFKPALDAFIAKGAASMAEVPYANMGSCNGTANGDAGNKLGKYRILSCNKNLYSGCASTFGMDVNIFKAYLAVGAPVVIGAKLGDRFMMWDSDEILSFDTYLEPGMKHAYHAMVLSGYDDTRRAFRVRNSWGAGAGPGPEVWGDGSGSIWVDYDFFLSGFCTDAYVAKNPGAEDWGAKGSSYDLAAVFAEDFADPAGSDSRDRALTYEILNGGTSPVLASQRWSVYYTYVNATDANDYGLLAEHYFTDEFGGPGESGAYGASAAATGLWSHANAAPGERVLGAEFEDGFYIPYRMPEITGNYYLVVHADAADAIEESSEENNFYFITAANGLPLWFDNGVMEPAPALAKFRVSGRAAPASSLARLGNLNGYTAREVAFVLNRDRKNGTLAKKAAELRK